MGLLRGGTRPRLLPGLALALSFTVAGCAALFSGYDLASNGLTRDEDAFRRDLAFAAPRAYQAAVEGRRSLPDDDLLRLLYAGIAGRYAGEHLESSRFLDVAAYLAEDRVTLSLSREALSLITSDRSLPYVPGRTERLMIPYLAALNFLDAGDTDGAAVEARRVEALLDQLHHGTAPEERPQHARFLHEFAGAVFQAAGDPDAAEVAFRRAGSAGTPADPVPLDGVGSDSGSVDYGEVVVLVERGFAPHRVEQSVIVVIPPFKAKKLTEGSGGEKAAAAAEAAARILLTASLHYGDRGGLYQDQRFRSGIHLEPWRDEPAPAADDDDEEDGGNPYLLRISWPVLYQDPTPAASVRVRAGDTVADVAARFDVAAGVRRDFDDQRVTTLARTVARAASKLAITAAVETSIAKRDEDIGRVAGLLTNLGTLATERADTRGWHLLPGDIAMVRLRLPAGSHELTLDGHGADGATTDLGTVEVRAGQTTFVTTRVWR